MSEQTRIRLATDDDLERVFGPGRLVIGFPVRPPAEQEPQSAEPPAEPGEQQG
jgi:hypothetical protein